MQPMAKSSLTTMLILQATVGALQIIIGMRVLLLDGAAF